ncbi:hypothetical protein J2X76_003640 [Neorhizobium sp. 2083]|uniref:helix-turn-helix domain-containing protein n=1 Tax=Neorhizobium sp. 2083 TaxID=2817762 RepID=UPI002855BB97|nr:helix-turn-helix domain-containing protein [Neorhizobium sp. 2083]MDR6818463.1 hypothetical protein [Neorhizobium sp. 2083]
MSLGMKPENFQTGLSGKRREVAEIKAIRYPDRWFGTSEGRHQQFKDWRYVAMQVLQKNDVRAFRVLAILEDVFEWETFDIRLTDGQLSQAAGHCSSKTVSRELADLRRVGLILVDYGWTQKGGKNVKGRRVRLAFPADIGGIHIR